VVGTALFAVPTANAEIVINIHLGLAVYPGHFYGVHGADHLASLAALAEVHIHLGLYPNCLHL
jgi:hypothetical protein